MMKKSEAFTLAELLIALAILGVIATFTIPKVLTSQTDTKYKAIAKETFGMVSGAYDAYRQDNSPSSATTAGMLSAYMNYVSVDTVGTIDNVYWTSPSVSCTNSGPCLRLHNGAVLQIGGSSFGGTANTNMLYFMLDPDGKVTEAGSPAYATGKSILLFLYFNGRIMSYGTCLAGTVSASWTPTCPSPGSGPDPTWFSWN